MDIASTCNIICTDTAGIAGMAVGMGMAFTGNSSPWSCFRSSRRIGNTGPGKTATGRTLAGKCMLATALCSSLVSGCGGERAATDVAYAAAFCCWLLHAAQIVQPLLEVLASNASSIAAFAFEANTSSCQTRHPGICSPIPIAFLPMAQTWVFSLLELWTDWRRFLPLLAVHSLEEQLGSGTAGLGWVGSGTLSDLSLFFLASSSCSAPIPGGPQTAASHPLLVLVGPSRVDADTLLHIGNANALLAQPEVHTQIGTFWVGTFWACTCSLAHHHSKGQVGAVISLFNHSKGQVGAVIDLFRGDLCCPGKIGAHLGRTNNQGTTSLRPKGAAGMHATVDKPLLHRSVQTTPTQELWQHSYTGALTPETTANPVPSEFCTEKNSSDQILHHWRLHKSLGAGPCQV